MFSKVQKLAVAMKLAAVMLFLGHADAAHALSGGELIGNWRGTLSPVYNSCGTNESNIRFRHNLITGIYGPVTYVGLRSSNGLGAAAFFQYIGSNSSGGYFRAVAPSRQMLTNRISRIYAYTYSAIKNNRANVEFYVGLSDIYTGETCAVIFRGRAVRS